MLKKILEKNYDYNLSMSGYLYSRPKDYDETVNNHERLYEALQNLLDVLKETGIEHKI